jgi:hypothetical protein
MTLPLFLGNITAALLFLSLAWLAASVWFPKRTSNAHPKVAVYDSGLPEDDTVILEEFQS